VGDRTDWPAERSRKIPNPASRHRTGEISIAWGLWPFESGEYWTDMSVTAGKRCGQEYPRALHMPQVTLKGRNSWFMHWEWVRQRIFVTNSGTANHSLVRNRLRKPGSNADRGLLSFRVEVSASSRDGARIQSKPRMHTYQVIW
jgi:hypothetical protein